MPPAVRRALAVVSARKPLISGVLVYTKPCLQAIQLQLTHFFFSSRRRHTRCSRDWSSDVCSSDHTLAHAPGYIHFHTHTTLAHSHSHSLSLSLSNSCSRTLYHTLSHSHSFALTHSHSHSFSPLPPAFKHTDRKSVV